MTGLLNNREQPNSVQVTKIIINLAPGVAMPGQVVEAVEYRQVEDREIPEGDSS